MEAKGASAVEKWCRAVDRAVLFEVEIWKLEHGHTIEGKKHRNSAGKCIERRRRTSGDGSRGAQVRSISSVGGAPTATAATFFL